MADESSRMQFEGKFEELKGRIKESWGSLTDDDLKRTEGKWDQVVGTIKQKTGEATEKIEEKLHNFMN